MIHPTRSSSLNSRSTSDSPYGQPATSGQVIYENGQYQDRPSPNQETVLPLAKNGLQDLAGTRAQLLAVQRRLLEQFGTALGWHIGWGAILPSLSHKEELTEVDLNKEEEDAEDSALEKEPADAERRSKLTTPVLGISASVLVNAVSSMEQFRQFYEVSKLAPKVTSNIMLNASQNLSDLIVKHYMAAGQTKSAESVLGDLAALRL